MSKLNLPGSSLTAILFCLLVSYSCADELVNRKFDAINDGTTKVISDFLKVNPTAGHAVVFAIVKSSVNKNERSVLLQFLSYPLDQKSAHKIISYSDALTLVVEFSQPIMAGEGEEIRLKINYASSTLDYLTGSHQTNIQIGAKPEEYLSISYIRRVDFVYSVYIFTL